MLQRVDTGIDAETNQCALRWQQEGKTVAFFGWSGRVEGVLAFGDKVRDSASVLVEELQQRGIKVHVVSGDSQSTTRYVTSTLGVDSFAAECLPQEKAELVRKLQADGSKVAMIGDGINDAPALAQADLGIAMGSGTDLAMKAAAVVLMGNSLTKVLEVFRLAQKTMRIVRQNLFWAFFYNLVGISLAVFGLLNPIIATGAMLLSSISVVANSLRLTKPVPVAKNTFSGIPAARSTD